MQLRPRRLHFDAVAGEVRAREGLRVSLRDLGWRRPAASEPAECGGICQLCGAGADTSHHDPGCPFAALAQPVSEAGRRLEALLVDLDRSVLAARKARDKATRQAERVRHEAERRLAEDIARRLREALGREEER